MSERSTSELRPAPTANMQTVLRYLTLSSSYILPSIVQCVNVFNLFNPSSHHCHSTLTHSLSLCL